MKLDRKAFSIKTFAQADNNRAYWLTKTPAERLAAAWRLSCRLYRLDPDNKEDIKLDRNYFKIRKRL